MIAFTSENCANPDEVQLCVASHFGFALFVKVLAERFPVYTRPRGYKTFSCSTQLSTKFILLINVKMPTIIGILTFITMINTTYESLKARNFFHLSVF